MSLNLSNLNRNPTPHHHLQTSNQKIKVNVNATTPTSLSMPIPHIRHQSETSPLSSAISQPKPYRQNVLSGTDHIKMHILYRLNRSISTKWQTQDIQPLCHKNTKDNVIPPQVTQSHNTKSLIHHPPKKRSHQGSAYPNIKHYRTIASFMHSTIYLTSSSVT